jgi:hypothetical protein|nr:hypothetical protein [uncultured Steroidobacter sp.]
MQFENARCEGDRGKWIAVAASVPVRIVPLLMMDTLKLTFEKLPALIAVPAPNDSIVPVLVILTVVAPLVLTVTPVPPFGTCEAVPARIVP